MSDGSDNISQSDEGSKCSNDSFTVPGVSEFASLQNPNQSPPSWNRGLTQEDIIYMNRKLFEFIINKLLKK